jgi:hypothetical protein
MALLIPARYEYIPATTAMQIFAVVPGVAGGLAGFWLARRIAERNEVRTSDVLKASGTVALATILAVLLVPTTTD